VEDTYLVGRQNAGFLFPCEVQMRILIAAAVVAAFAVSPASAEMMKCTSANMMKSAGMMAPYQNASNKEMAMANADLSNGKMRSACMHYMKSQKSAMK
jgi:hypothetical protein